MPATASQRSALTPEQALHALVDRLHSRLYRLAARITGSAADAEDVVQDAFLRAHRSVKAGQLLAEELTEPLLVKTVSHLCLNWLRGRTRSAAREADYAPPAVNAVDQADARVALRQLSELLDGLPPPQRAALVLKELEGLSTREVAAALGCSEGAVEQRLIRARLQLKEKTHG